ncbi:MAG TPA: L-seryl-tRNA(Sec) selenium transferase, partial [Solirubrobacteraceae bacterium]|nr:L-seryl-tRNA(Sec) selenium transferase [Solirubrobacteraceae bacterium]
ARGGRVGAGRQAGVNPALRDLPSVDRLATILAREVLAERRTELLGGGPAEADLLARARARLRPSLRRVVNATGVIVHTNLGRAPLPAAARAAVDAAATGYANLELDLSTGRRGSRHEHVEGILCELTGAQAAMVVNNCAAATLLAAAALGGPGREIVVSRGQLIEIGGSFRMPDVVKQSGSALVEVGTTNRTRLDDYSAALTERTGAILRAHRSNFRLEGFVTEPSVEELCALDVPVVDDVGSGWLDDAMLPGLEEEPAVRRSVRAGAALVLFSGDKLLGGPQAGLIVGTRDAVERARRHPLARALRIDKLSLAALEATLGLYRDPQLARREVPVLAMLAATPEELADRARELATQIGGPASVVAGSGRVGGGSLPTHELAGPVVALEPGPSGADALAATLRTGDPPVLARIAAGRVLLDPRTIADDELGPAAAAARAALG